MMPPPTPDEPTAQPTAAQPTAAPSTGAPSTGAELNGAEPADAWGQYLAAAQRLDVVRRAASSIVSEQATTVQAGWQELAAVRARLAPQRARLVHDLGVPEAELVPQPAEQAAAAQAVAGGPAAALTALRQARGIADAADAAMLASASRPGWTPWMRNLLVYGPFAAAVLIVQVALYLIASSDSLPTFALVCGLTMPVLAFGLGWLTIGFVFGARGTRVDRTPVLGAIVCLAPVVLTCMGVGLQAILR